MTNRLMPRQPVPDLEVDLLSGERWSLTGQRPRNFTLLVFYRGLHCPICRGYLRELDRLAGEFAERGVELLALSTDGAERAGRARTDWGLENVPIGYGLTIERAREWGLYVSTSRGMTSIGVEEPALFSEPGLFLVRPDRTLYAAVVQTMPFSRPNFKELLGAVDFILSKDYPARGEA